MTTLASTSRDTIQFLLGTDHTPLSFSWFNFTLSLDLANSMETQKAAPFQQPFLYCREQRRLRSVDVVVEVTP